MKLFCIEDYSDDDKKLMEHIFKFILQSKFYFTFNRTLFASKSA